MSSPRKNVSLDGTWSLASDTKHVGLDARWFEAVPDIARELQLPTMQSQGIASQGGVGWYYKSFEYDETWAGRFITLSIGAVTYPVTVWINGTRLGEHVGGGTPVSFPVGAQLRSGANLLAIRIALRKEDESDSAEIPGRYPLDFPADVELSIVPKVHIEQIFLQPDIRRKRLKVYVEAPADTTVHLQIEGTGNHTEGAPGEFNLEFPEFICWSPSTPELYVLRTDLIGSDGTIDSVSTTFGMREFTVKDERFYLNNRPYYVKCVSYVPNYPENLKADKFALLLKRELTLLCEGGFNTLRVCGGPAPTALLDLADRMGILVFTEVASPHRYGVSSDWNSALEALALRDQNRTCLVAWCGAHVSYDDAKPGDRRAASCATHMRSLDPSRLILCDAPQDPLMGMRSATLLRPYRDNEESYEAFDTSVVPPVGALAKDYLRHAGDPARLNFQGRINGGGVVTWADGSPSGRVAQSEFEAAYVARKLDRCFGTMDAFFAASQTMQLDAIQTQLDSVRANVKMVGYGIESLCDGPGSTPFGLADHKRQPKPVLRALKEIQHAVRPVVQIYKTNLVPREEVSVTILLINEERLEGRGELSLQVVGPTNQVLWKKKRLVKIPRHGKELWTGDISASGSPGPHRFVVRLIQDRRVVGENSVALHVVQPHTADPVEVNVLGDQGPWRTAIGRLAKLHNFLAPIHIIPPLSNTIRAYPSEDLIQVMAQVNEGAIAIVFGPPKDWNDFTEYAGASLKVTTRNLTGDRRINHHYSKVHPVFEGIPSRDLMRQPYQNILSHKAFEAESDEEMTGVHSVWRGVEDGEDVVRHWWGNNITVKRLGAGRVVFTHLKVLEHLGLDPVADRVFVNMLQHFSRRSIPATEIVSVDQRATDWMRQERSVQVRKWMVIGSFANWNGRSGHDAIYPPEAAVDLEATYPGWYRAVQWKPWTTLDSHRHTLDFTAALDSDVGTGEACPYATAYAYAEFSSDRRQEIVMNLEGQSALKIWLNGVLVHETDFDQATSDNYEAVVSWVRQGKNTVLIKCSKGHGPFSLSVDFEGTGTTPPQFNWWK